LQLICGKAFLSAARFLLHGQAVYRPAQPISPDTICRYRVFGHLLSLQKMRLTVSNVIKLTNKFQKKEKSP
ncbi:hypothetical protein, partial [uncultured Oscillibacter sp.]|uniref:hypothetical protein n=1 Tax=uncultured Oscillibacter sp. TaxID=876091 RepID=UPI0025F5BF8F